MTDYVNKPEVRKALNIDNSIHTFELCNKKLDYDMETEGSSWIYPILKNKMRILFYSGDTDGTVPSLGSRKWI